MRTGGLESVKVDTRLVCSASESLLQQTEAGSFRLDLLFRINPITIQLPTLRERIVDLPILIDYFLDFYSTAYRRNPKPLSRDITKLMERYDWPGNIRQLENMIRSYALFGSEEYLVAELAPYGTASLTYPISKVDLTIPISLSKITKSATNELEKRIILKVLVANAWSRCKTAKWLNISQRSLQMKLLDLLGPGTSDLPTKTKTSASLSFPLRPRATQK